jgi:glyoxylase-like metal-dependent hydrolase (beta-lactamase superfamily II)
MQVAPGIHRIGNGTINSYLIAEGGEVTIIDAGVPGYYRDLPAELESMGSSIDRVRALLLTHGHSDHIGFGERLRAERKVPVSVHEIDATLARGEIKNPGGATGKIRPLPLLRFLLYAGLRGGLRNRPLGEVSTFGEGATLDVPGSPRVILVPGHTPGSAVLHVPSLNAAFVGDAMATYSVVGGMRGPMIAPFTADRGQALTSLSRLDDLDAKYVLPGHGEPWTDGVQTAVRAVRASESPSG